MMEDAHEAHLPLFMRDSFSPLMEISISAQLDCRKPKRGSASLLKVDSCWCHNSLPWPPGTGSTGS